MGYSEWGYDIDTVDENFVKEVAKKEYDNLNEIIDGDWTSLARSVTSDEEDSQDNYISGLISDLGREEDEDKAFEEIMNAYHDLRNKVKESTGLNVDLFASTADLGNCEISEDDYFFVASNLYILNPEISSEVREKIYKKNVVQGG